MDNYSNGPRCCLYLPCRWRIQRIATTLCVYLGTRSRSLYHGPRPNSPSVTILNDNLVRRNERRSNWSNNLLNCSNRDRYFVFRLQTSMETLPLVPSLRFVARNLALSILWREICTSYSEMFFGTIVSTNGLQ